MNRLLSFLRFMLILILCLGCAFVIVWPLWKFATVNGKAYTITTLIVFGALAVYGLIRKIRSKIKEKHESEV